MYQHSLHFHFVGCNNPLSRNLIHLLQRRGHTTSECDGTQKSSPITDITSADIVVFSPDFSGNNPKLQAARAAQIPTIATGHLLAELIGHTYTISVTGMHGKTTTAALISHIMHDNRWQPTVMLPSPLRNGMIQAIDGRDEWSVTTANINDQSLQRIHPTIAVVTNLADQQKSDELITTDDAYTAHLKTLPFYGYAVLCHDDTSARNLRSIKPTQTLTYGLSAHAHVRGHIVHINGDHSIFNVSDKKDGLLGSVRIPLPGDHNIVNALGAIAVCHHILNIPFEHIQKSIARFQGVARRFEYVGNYNNARVIDDYATHPTQVNATLRATYGSNHQKLHVVFQPTNNDHLKSMWQSLLNVFVKHQTKISTLHIAPILKRDGSKNNQLDAEQFATNLSDMTKNISLFCYQQIDEIIASLKSIVQAGDLLVVMGTDGVQTIARTLVQK